MTTPSTLLFQAAPPPVIVVGSGLAGLAAATQLISHHNIPVQLLERSPKLGGNSIKASSGINGAPTRFQPTLSSATNSNSNGNDVTSIDDQFYNDTIRSAGTALTKAASTDEKQQREKLISALTGSSADAVYWLTDSKGIDLSKVSQLGGHSRPRTHRGGPGQKTPGASIIGTLLEGLEKSPNFNLRTGAKVTKVLRESDEVMGVEYEDNNDNNEQAKTKTETLKGPVVFASGGFAGDAHGLLAQYRPDLAGFPTTNQAREGTQPLLTAVGARLVDMERVQIHPTGFVDPNDAGALNKILAAEMLRGEGGILLARDGKRFVNELNTRDKVTDAVMSYAEALHSNNNSNNNEPAATKQWDVSLLLDETTAQATSSHLGFYRWKGLVKQTTVGELGPSALETIREYGQIASGRKSDSLGRKAFANWTLGRDGGAEVTPQSVVLVGKVTPVVHFTMGGALINEHSQVLDTNGKPIHGLWAAGEITGGIHGGNRLGGSSFLECVVFGRIAADQAAAFYESHYKNGGFMKQQ